MQAALNKTILTSVTKRFKARITDRREIPEISERLLGEYSQLWLFFGEAGSKRRLSDAELNTISRFVNEGKSMLIVAGKQQASADDMLAVNQLSSRYGVLFSGFVENRDELPVTVASHVFNKASEIVGRILKLVNKA